ncbi:MAG: TAT-variant-translocated molybdopterin oxidoreductase, partial [Gemmatimonadetes bacterium]|nr:TAT-variant-translocated molybdopterin oxidoreductase [Gemmatimonadota bacterium]
MSSVDGPKQAPAHWRSLEELHDTPEFREIAEREFKSLLPEGMPAATRRRFLQLMGASMTLAGTGCSNVDPSWPRYEEAKILPHAFRPPGHDPGKPFHFATSFEVGGVARPVLAKSYDGRPIKIEGNPDHPASRGAADAITQASILDLYDPDRSTSPAQIQGDMVTESTWDALSMFFRTQVTKTRGGQGMA